MKVSSQYYYNILRSLLSYKQGNIEAAVSSQKVATLINAKNPHYREDFLWNDLAWLETLCRKAKREEDFKSFCHELKGVSKIEQWYLVKEKLENVEWGKEVTFEELPTGWIWIDPLGKGSYKIEHGFEITPVMGTGGLCLHCLLKLPFPPANLPIFVFKNRHILPNLHECLFQNRAYKFLLT